MKKLSFIIFIFSIYLNAIYAENFSTIMLKNTVHLAEEKYINHTNDPLPISKGTGFIINLEQPYIVTVKHLLRDIKSNNLIVEKYGEKYIEQRIIPIKDNGRPLWFEHQSEDIILIPTQIYNSNLSEKHLDLKQEVELGSYALSIGFTYGTYEAKIRGGNISFNILQDNIKEIFFNTKVVDGESGSPAFIPNTQKIIGIVSGREESSDFAIIVPMHFITEIKRQLK